MNLKPHSSLSPAHPSLSSPTPLSVKTCTDTPQMSYSTSGSPSPSSPAKILVDHLQTGFNAAEQLRRRLLRSPDSDDLSISDVDLAELIFNSFSNSLAIATNSDSLIANPRLISADGCKTEEEGSGRGESSRIKDRRGCYKRRKRGQSWTTEGEAPKEDGHAWRKYGQKMILNSKFPRNYYRCTHKTDQGCQAQKQVQKVSDEPPLYRTTYSGNHTCKSPHKTPEVMIPDQSDSSFLVSFERTSNHHISPFFPTPVKEELPTTQAMMNMMMMSNQPCLSDYAYLSSPDPNAGGPHLASTPTPAGSDYGGDVISVGTYSCSASPPSLEIDHYILGQDHLDDLIQFD